MLVVSWYRGPICVAPGSGMNQMHMKAQEQDQAGVDPILPAADLGPPETLDFTTNSFTQHGTSLRSDGLTLGFGRDL